MDRRRNDRVCAGLALLTLVLGMIAVLSPLTAGGMPATHDGHLHIQRAMAIDGLVGAGTPFSRWLPDFAYGYGTPLFNYYAPLVYLPMAAFRLLGAGYADAFELTTALAVITSGAAMYLCLRSLFGRTAAVIGGLVYACLPYQLVNVYVRGALAETAAAFWLPLGCWCLIRLHQDRRQRWLAGLALCVAGLTLTHNVTALIALPALVGLAVALAHVPAQSGRRGYAVGVSTAIVVGIGLAAWFWVPAIAERTLVQIDVTIEPELFRSYFLRDWPPFQTSLAYDYERPTSDALGTPIYWPQMGSIQLSITLVGIVVFLRSGGTARRVLAWAIGLFILAWGLQFAVAAPLFDTVPLARFVQFPWRLLIFAGLASAVLAAGAIESLGRQRPAQIAIAGVVVGLTLWTALWRLSPSAEYPEDRFVTAEALTRAEQADFGLGSTHGGEYLPVSSGQRSSARLWKDLRTNDTETDRRESESPVAFKIEALEWSPQQVRARVYASHADRLVLHQFFFPGWTARVDGSTVPITPAGQLGLIAVDIPAGTREVELAFEWTPVRVGGIAISAVALLALGALAAPSAARLSALARGRRAALGASTAAVAAAVAVWFALGMSSSAAATTPTTWHEIEGEFALVGARLDASRLRDGSPLVVETAWLALVRPRESYDALVVVQASNGTRHEAHWAHGPLMRSWERGELVKTDTNVRLPAEFPAGRADVSLVILSREAREPRLPTTIPLGAISVPGDGRIAPTGFATADEHKMADSLVLESHELYGGPWPDTAAVAARGMPYGARLAWRALGTPTQDLAAVLTLSGNRGQFLSAPHTVGGWFMLPPGWQAGDRFRQEIRLTIPDDLAEGRYDVMLELHGGDPTWAGIAPQSAFALRAKGQPLAERSLGSVLVVP